MRREDVDFVNVLDGAAGTVGPKGADGRTTILHIAYANSADGSVSFSVDNPEGRTYIGQYTDYTAADSTDPTKYKWTLVKGEKGDKGDQGPQGLNGLQGPKGDQGLPGAKGADGKTSYTHVAYANSADGRSAFSTSDSNRTYIGVYADQVATDSTDPARYKWTLIKGADGAQGIPGANGADGRTPYLHIAYANNSTGTAGFSTTDSAGRTYIGQYTDYTAADSTNPASYKWTLVKGEDGAVNITCGFTQGFSDGFTATSDGVGAITALSDGWAKMKYTNTTSSVKRVEGSPPRMRVKH